MTGWVALLLGTGEQTFSLVIKNHEMKYLLNYIYIDNNLCSKNTLISIEYETFRLLKLYFKFVLESVLIPRVVTVCSAAGCRAAVLHYPAQDG